MNLKKQFATEYTEITEKNEGAHQIFAARKSMQFSLCVLCDLCGLN
jgi:hypothetical protein